MATPPRDPSPSDPSPASARLAVESRPGGRSDTAVLLLKGELDHDTAAPLRSALQSNDEATRLVVDCAGLRFCDSTGLNLLLRARLRHLARGGSVDLSGLRSPVARVFEITGALLVFRVFENVEAALDDSMRTSGPGRRSP
ncbi:STAS domain-containing protein [Streptomyces wedmorensis]